MNDIQLTSSAAAHFQQILQKQKDAVGLRLGVKDSGCNGLSYVLEVANEVKAKDKIFTSEGVAVLVDEQGLPFLKGTIIDWVREGLNESVQFRNPNVKGACGCGESFST